VPSPEIKALDSHAPATAIDDGDESLSVAMDDKGNTVIFTQEALPLMMLFQQIQYRTRIIKIYRGRFRWIPPWYPVGSFH